MGALGNDVPGTVIFALSCSVLLATCIALIRDAQCHQLWSRLRWAASLAAQALRFWHKAEHDEVNVLVQARLQELRVEHFRWGCKCLCIALCLPTLTVARRSALELPRFNTPTQDAAQVTVHAILALVTCRPSVLSWRTIDVVYGALAILAAVFLFPGATGEVLIPTQVVIPVLGVAVLGACRRSLLVNLATTGLLAAMAYGAMTHHRDSVQNMETMLGVQVIFQICFAAAAKVLDTTLGDTIRQGMEMGEARELIQAASALLRSTCDAMVELSSEGVVLSGGKDLANLLLRPCHHFHNSRFADAIAHEEDRERFSRKLSSPTLGGTEMAEAIHVHMRDGNNDAIRTQVLWFRWHRVDGQQRYMVGVREFSDACAAGGLPLPSPRRRAAADRGSDSDSDGDVSLGASEASSEVSADSLMTEEEQLAVVTVDSTDPHLPVLNCSPGFRMRVGRLAPGMSLGQRVRRSDGFLRWLQAAVNAVLEGGDRPQCHVTLELRQGRVRATCRILVKDEEGAVDVESVHLLFFDVRQNPRHSGPRHGPRPSPGSQLRGTPVVHISM